MWNQENIIKATEIRTSLRPDSIYLSFVGESLIVNSLPLWMLENNIMICVSTRNGNELYRKIFQAVLPYIINIKLPDGYYYLQLYYESRKGSNYFCGINSADGFPINVKNGELTSIVPITLASNKSFFLSKKADSISRVFYSQHTSNYQSNLLEIKSLSDKITKYKTGNYQKILAIHDWVAENLYYDKDALEDGSYCHEKYDVLSMLNNRRTVCRGYSKMAVTLLRAIGIPAMDVHCFALGESSDGDWGCDNNLTAESNHVLTFALADNRWVIMDPTWDSVNEYKNGKYIEKSAGGARHNYFDATLAFFSYTHRFIK